MATRSGSALASLSARLRPISAATAAGGWRRLLSDDPTKGSTEDKERVEDENKHLEDPNMREELPMANSAHPVHTQAQSENISFKEQLEQSRKAMDQLKDQLEKAELENQLLKNQIHKAENENSFKDHLEESRKETKQLKNQLEEAEAEKRLLKDKIHKDLETVICKQTVNFESKLANDRMHIDESTREMQHRSEEFKRNVKLNVFREFRLKEKCPQRSGIVEGAITVLERKNTKFQKDLIVKVQQAQYNVVKTTALAAVAIGGTLFFGLRFFKKGE